MQKVPELIFHSGVMQKSELTFYCRNHDKYMTNFEVLKAVTVKVMVSWNVMPHTVADRGMNNLKKPSAYS